MTLLKQKHWNWSYVVLFRFNGIAHNSPNNKSSPKTDICCETKIFACRFVFDHKPLQSNMTIELPNDLYWHNQTLVIEKNGIFLSQHEHFPQEIKISYLFSRNSTGSHLFQQEHFWTSLDPKIFFQEERITEYYASVEAIIQCRMYNSIPISVLHGRILKMMKASGN